MTFSKMQGLGNDFVVLDCMREPPAEAGLPELARRLCDRHFGIGADGLLLALPDRDAGFRMRILNADGTEAENCGNGLRCIARFLYDRGYTRSESISIATLGRVNSVRILPRDGADPLVCVDMGAPSFARSSLPMLGPPESEAIEEPIRIGDGEMRFTCVSMGNPHAVAFVEDVERYPVERVGPLVESHPLFPRRTNAEFVEVIGPAELRMRVWERGAGETLACGTGACASLAAAARTGRTGRRATLHLRGGDLEIEWREDGRIAMTGPAVEVFRGQLL